MLNLIELFFFSQAEDPDTFKEITYIIKQGNTEMFSIDRKTGVVKTIRGLDYERENMYILVIGTEENDSMMEGSITKVTVDVEVDIYIFKQLRLKYLINGLGYI